jgi:YrbI family 3-deoxy-D-manno-octulosonate 8-phosphate phosphatase
MFNIIKKIFAPKRDFSKIKIFLSDVDGVLTDCGMYYTQDGNEFKKFNTHDGMGFDILAKNGYKRGIITSEDTNIVANRAKKLNLDFIYQGARHKGKLQVAKEICEKENISLENVAYIGDDINCIELLEKVGICACPANATKKVKAIKNIIHLDKKGGDGVVREFIDMIIDNS